jgi:hypothetical protein
MEEHRMAIDTTAVPATPPAISQVVWYRHSDQVDDHAFGVGEGWMRSRCREIRWNVLMRPVDGSVRACPGCLAAVAPITESELRLLDGNR